MVGMGEGGHELEAQRCDFLTRYYSLIRSGNVSRSLPDYLAPNSAALHYPFHALILSLA